jgi:membrane dipeptidase
VEIQDRFLLIDAHSDLLNDVLPKRNMGRKAVIEQDWLPGMRKGGIDVRVAAIYSDIEYIPELALRRALDMIAALFMEIEESSEIVLCKTVDDIRRAKNSGKIGFILGMEGAEPLGRDISLLRIFYALGLRVLGLTHALRNYAADPAPIGITKTSQTSGLSDFGLQVVQEANKLGMVIDVSHLNDPGFWDVLENSTAPVIASHSNSRAVFNHPRGLSDDQIRAVAQKGGVIGINACATLVSVEKEASIGHLLDHLDHIVKIGGIESVGLGPDFCDYVWKYASESERARLPHVGPVRGLSGDPDIPYLIKAMYGRGYSHQEIELIAGKNFLRVFETVWK